MANEACDAGRVSINGKTAKAGTNVACGDIIEINFGTSAMKVKVLKICDSTRKEDAEGMYENL